MIDEVIADGKAVKMEQEVVAVEVLWVRSYLHHV